jgi:hypothetical protein
MLLKAWEVQVNPSGLWMLAGSGAMLCMKKLQPKQSRVKFSTRFLLEGITPSSGVSLGSRSSLWKYHGHRSHPWSQI